MTAVQDFTMCPKFESEDHVTGAAPAERAHGASIIGLLFSAGFHGRVIMMKAFQSVSGWLATVLQVSK